MCQMSHVQQFVEPSTTTRAAATRARRLRKRVADLAEPSVRSSPSLAQKRSKTAGEEPQIECKFLIHCCSEMQHCPRSALDVQFGAAAYYGLKRALTTVPL